MCGMNNERLFLLKIYKFYVYASTPRRVLLLLHRTNIYNIEDNIYYIKGIYMKSIIHILQNFFFFWRIRFII